jgi:hypothetical protein
MTTEEDVRDLKKKVADLELVVKQLVDEAGPLAQLTANAASLDSRVAQIEKKLGLRM